MAATTFHSFPLLPGELRDQIWDDAVRPVGLRGVQYFTHHWFNYPDGFEGRFKHHMMVPTLNPYQGLGPALPVDDWSPPSWNNTQSTYSIDGGLWTACKESRAAMERRYKFKPLAELQASQGDCGTYFPEVPALFPVEENGKRQYITIEPNRDLVVLQQWTGSILEDFGQVGSLSSIFPRTKYYFGGIKDIAVEFDPSWSIRELKLYCSDPRGQKFDNDRHAVYEELVDITKAVDGPWFNLWMVDPTCRLTLTAFSEYQSSHISQRQWEDRVVFTANDCSYYEPHNWEAVDVDETVPEDDDHCIVGFTRALEDLCEEDMEVDARLSGAWVDPQTVTRPRWWRFLIRGG